MLPWTLLAHPYSTKTDPRRTYLVALVALTGAPSLNHWKCMRDEPWAVQDMINSLSSRTAACGWLTLRSWKERREWKEWEGVRERKWMRCTQYTLIRCPVGGVRGLCSLDSSQASPEEERVEERRFEVSGLSVMLMQLNCRRHQLCYAYLAPPCPLMSSLVRAAAAACHN